MEPKKRILVAVDHSKASERAVQYVANAVGNNENFIVQLLHVVGPMPDGLLEFGGSEDPRVESILDRELRDKRRQWRENEEKAAQSLLQNARSVLERAGVPASAIETGVSARAANEDVAMDLLEEARDNHCNTIVVGRESFSWLRELSHRHVGDELIHKGRGLSIWVVE